VIITPEKVTMLVGESRPFRLVDEKGTMQHDVSWTVSDPDDFQTQTGDEFVITAKKAGDFQIEAWSAAGSAEASVTVVEGQSLRSGTVKWSAGSYEGCKVMQVVPAVPSANGPDIFTTSKCDDGGYVAAFTSDGIELWRRKIGAAGPAPFSRPRVPIASVPGNSASHVARLDATSQSVCDLAGAGTPQAKIRLLLNQRQLSFSERASDHAWVVAESSSECDLWFSSKAVLVKKKKIFVSQ
jgi:hypothetical protein